VASATVYDLTAPPPPGSDVTIAGGIDGASSGYWTTIATDDPSTTDIPIGSSGTGVFEAFLRTQAPGTEEGYNTTADILDNKNDPHTHNLLLADIPISTTLLNGNFVGDHYEFFMDGQQSDELLSIQDVQFFITQDPSQSVTTFTTGGLLELNNSRLVYSLDSYDSSGDKTLDNRVDLFTTTGQGRPELGVFIGKEYFTAAIEYMMLNAGWDLNDPIYVVLYTNMGGSPYGSNSAFEEWDTKATIPEPATILPLAFVLFAATQGRRHSKKQSA
jgi:hypothetical protein